MVKIVVNGQEKEVGASTLTELCAELNIKLEGTAISVNDEIVPKSTFESFALSSGMKIDIFSLVAGG